MATALRVSLCTRRQKETGQTTNDLEEECRERRRERVWKEIGWQTWGDATASAGDRDGWRGTARDKINVLVCRNVQTWFMRSPAGLPSSSAPESALRIAWYRFSANILDISLENSDKHGLFSIVERQFLIWSTSISHIEGSTSIPSVLCSLGSNGRPKRDFFRLVFPARSWPMNKMRPRYTFTAPSLRAFS